MAINQGASMPPVTEPLDPPYPSREAENEIGVLPRKQPNNVSDFNAIITNFRQSQGL